jgi:hypothetical protein
MPLYKLNYILLGHHSLSPLRFKTVNEEVKRYKPAGTDQIPAELIQAGGRAVHSKKQTY